MPYEIDFLRAGDSNGDAIVVKWGDTKDGDYYLNIIDGGITDTGDQVIEHIGTSRDSVRSLAANEQLSCSEMTGFQA